MLFRLKRHQTKLSEWQLIAILDLGSNTARLIIMRAIPGYAYRLEDEIREVVRLREGMTDEGLSEEAVERAMFTLQLFKRFCDSLEVDQVIATATSAVRDAANGQDFVDRVHKEIGWELNILSGETEAYYDCIGALNEVAMSEGFVMDIGGGSMQISEIRDRRYERGESLSLGSLALSERFVKTDPIEDSEFKALQYEIRRQLDTLVWVEPRRDWKLVGLGGTIRNLAKIESKRQNYPMNTLHGFELTRESIAESIQLFRKFPLGKRKDIPGLSSDRADIILSGALVVAEVLDLLKLESLTISENGVREGVFFEQFWMDEAYPVAEDVRRFSVLNLARVYHYHQEHAEHVQELVRRLFIQLAPLHNYGKQELEMLEAAALLHDLGTIINYKDHHKHSHMLIVSSGLPGYSPREVALVALLARYHRKGTPTPDEFTQLLKATDPIRLKRLAAILRMAEYLERGRSGAVSDIDVRLSADNITLDLISEFNPSVEIWDAERNAVPLFEDAFERKVRIECSCLPAD